MSGHAHALVDEEFPVKEATTPTCALRQNADAHRLRQTLSAANSNTLDLYNESS